MKHTLIHLSSGPYANLSCQEGLDLALVLATFEQPVDLCLSAGALSLLALGQAPGAEHGKNLHKLLAGLTFYDIDNIFIEENLAMQKSQVWSGTTPLNQAQWQALFSQYQQIFRF